MASSAASSKRKRQYACGSIDDCGDPPLDDNAMSLVVRWPTHTTDPTLCVALHTHKTHFFLRSFFVFGACQSCDDERRERELFFVFFLCFVFCVLCFVFFCARLFLFFFVCVFLIPKDIQAELLSEYPEYLRDSRVLIASLLSTVPLTHLLIFHLFSGRALLLRCHS